jgi:hypothetical protein
MLRWEASSVSLRACPENRQVNILLRKPEFELRVFETKKLTTKFNVVPGFTYTTPRI